MQKGFGCLFATDVLNHSDVGCQEISKIRNREKVRTNFTTAQPGSDKSYIFEIILFIGNAKLRNVGGLQTRNPTLALSVDARHRGLVYLIFCTASVHTCSLLAPGLIDKN